MERNKVHLSILEVNIVLFTLSGNFSYDLLCRLRLFSVVGGIFSECYRQREDAALEPK